MRISKACTGLSARLACHRRWNACGTCLPFGPEVGAVCGKAARTVLCGGRVMKHASLPLHAVDAVELSTDRHACRTPRHDSEKAVDSFCCGAAVRPAVRRQIAPVDSPESWRAYRLWRRRLRLATAFGTACAVCSPLSLRQFS